MSEPVDVIRTTMEEVLEGPVGVDDDFFDLGGDSLQASQVAALLSVRLERRVRVRDVMRERTARSLGRSLLAEWTAEGQN